MDTVTQKMERTKALLISLLEATMVAVAMNYKTVANDVFAGTSELFELWLHIDVLKLPKAEPEAFTKDGVKVGPAASLYSESYVQFLEDQIQDLTIKLGMSKEELFKAREARDEYKGRFHALDKDMDGTMNVLNEQYAKIVDLKAKLEAKDRTEEAVSQNIYDCDEDG